MKTNIIITFDTTSSMYPCIHEVRRKISELSTHLFETFPNLQLGIIGHGNLWDADSMMQKFPLTNDPKEISDAVYKINATYGGGYNVSGVGPPAAYEVALESCYDYFNLMQLDNTQNFIIMIGDSVPHRVGDSAYGNKCDIDYKKVLNKLLDIGVKVFSVQCLSHKNANYFYKAVAEETDGNYITLNQFNQISELLQLAIYSVENTEMAETFASGFTNRGLQLIAQQILNKKLNYTISKRSDGLIPVPPARFQVLNVDDKVEIRDFVNNTGATYKKGRGFYQLTKTETIQEQKEVVLVNKETGDMFSGDEARNIIGIPFGQRDRLNPRLTDAVKDWEIFVQSTSVNRKLQPNSKFLYEV